MPEGDALRINLVLATTVVPTSTDTLGTRRNCRWIQGVEIFGGNISGPFECLVCFESTVCIQD